MCTFLTAQWRKLIMAQYEVSPEILEPFLPEGVELDLFRNRCYISLVGFLYDRVRLLRMPIPFHTSFEGINLRFYVRRMNAMGTWDRGVVFIREFVPSPAIGLIGKAIYDQEYTTAPTAHRIIPSENHLSVEYMWTFDGRAQRMCVEAALTPEPVVEGSEEEFMTDHYWGFARRRNGTTSAYRVARPRWETYRVQNHGIAANFSSMYGEAFAGLNYQLPSSVLLAHGSAVSISDGVFLT
ncbi:MAG: DUF2071 domain-containing protein [Acidobacteriota bacterium]